MAIHYDPQDRVAVLNEPSAQHRKGTLEFLRMLGGAIFCLCVGTLYSIYVFGLHALNPRNISILPEDASQAYMGWLFFRHEEHLTLPLGWAWSLGYPNGEPIAYLDSMPLVATLLWPFRHWLPEPFQYLTPWWVLCAVLSFYFGSRITRRLCGGDWLCAIAGGLLFMTAPTLILRAWMTFALSSHWLILAALEFFLSCSARLSWRQVVASIAIAAVAAGINPYISFLSLMLIGAGYLRSLITAATEAQVPLPRRLLVALAGMAAAVVVTLLLWLLFGFLRLDDSNVYAGGSYGRVSMNLLSPISPGGFPALLLKPQPELPLQSDGYNYFGLGVLLLGFVVFVRAPRMAAAHLTQRDAWPAWLVAVICTLMALSIKATVGTHVIYDLNVPMPVLHILSAFRASGRLFWPAFYLSLAGIISVSFRVFGHRTIYALSCALAVQTADMRGLRNFIHEKWSTTPAAIFTGAPQNLFTNGPVWQDIGRRYRHLAVLPAWQCAPYGSPGGELGFWTFGKLAGEHQMTTNSYYSARSGPKELDYFCHQMPDQLRKNGLTADTAYVFTSAAAAYAFPRNEDVCRGLDDVVLCVRGSDATFGHDASADLLELPLGQTISVSSSNPSSDKLFARGWWYPEDWGRWTVERETSLSFRVQGAGGVRVDLALRALATQAHPQNVQIFVNGTHAKDLRFTDGAENKISLDVPAGLIALDRVVTVKFAVPDAIAPTQLGIGNDDRELGLGLASISLASE